MTLARTLTHFFLPHHTNNHRPKALHIDALFAYVLLFAVFNLAIKTIHSVAPDVLGYATDIHVEQLLSSTNAKRAEAGLGTLTLNGQLSQAAAAKAADMFANNYWAHTSPQGRTPWEFISGAGYRYTVAGENLAKNFSNSGGVVDAWMASPSHRDNLLKAGYQEVGFAIVNGVLQGEETTLVVQMFGASRGVAAAPQQAPQVPQAPQAAPIVQVTVAPSPVVVPSEAAEAPTPAPMQPATPIQTVASAFADVTKRPLLDITAVSRETIFIFIGLMIGILILDMWIVQKRNILRISGHNMAHIFFLSTMLILIASVTRGGLL